MNKEVVEKLALARLYAQHASFAGIARQAVADGYSAVDAVLSALLALDGVEAPRNHKAKLDLVRKTHPDAFAPKVVRKANSTTSLGGVEWDAIESFYREWLRSRYESFDLKPAEAADRVRRAHVSISAAIRYIARKAKIGTDKLDARVAKQAFGYDQSELARSVGLMHDRLFSEAEQFGDEYGSRLGVKLAAATNYAELDLIAGDDLTRLIIRDDESVAVEGARAYEAFVKFAESLREKRYTRLLESGTEQSATDEAPNFMLSMKVRYHGATTKEMGESWGRTLSAALEMIATRHSRKQPRKVRNPG